MKQTIAILYVLSCLLFTAVPIALAQSLDLSLTPPVIEILLSPNHRVSQTFTITAQGSAVELTPTLHLAKPSDQDGHVTLDPSPLNESQLPLVITSSPPLNQPLMTNGRPTELTLTFEGASVDVPQDVYLALVMKSSSTVAQFADQNLGVGGGISSLIFITLTPVGTLPVSVEIEGFSPPLLHDSWTPLTLSPVLKNSAPIMVRPEGQFEVIGPSGNTIISLPLYPHLILGNGARSLKAKMAEQPTDLLWSPKWSNLGPHRLRLTITTQGGTKLTEVEKVVWILPLRILALGFVVLAIALAWYIQKKKASSPH